MTRSPAAAGLPPMPTPAPVAANMSDSMAPGEIHVKCPNCMTEFRATAAAPPSAARGPDLGEMADDQDLIKRYA